MIILGVILLLLGWLLGINPPYVLGVILLVIDLVFLLLDYAGHPIGADAGTSREAAAMGVAINAARRSAPPATSSWPGMQHPGGGSAWAAYGGVGAGDLPR